MPSKTLIARIVVDSTTFYIQLDWSFTESVFHPDFKPVKH